MKIKGFSERSFPFSEKRRWNHVRLMTFALSVAVFLFSVFPYGSEQLWHEAVFCMLVFVTAVIVILQSDFEGLDKDIKIVVYPLLILALYSFVQGAVGFVFPKLQEGSLALPFSYDSFSSLWITVKILAFVTYIFILGVVFKNHLKPLVWALVLAGNFFALFGIVRYVAQNTAPLTFGYFLLPGLGPNVGFGTFLNQNHFAYLMLMTLGINLCLLWRGNLSARIRILLAAFSLLTWAALVLTGSRAGILSSFVVVAALVFVPVGQRALRNRSDRNRTFSFWRRITVFGLLAAVLAFAVIFIGQDRVMHRFQQLPRELEGVENSQGFRRFDVYSATLEMIGDQPIFGIGFGSFQYSISEHIDIAGITVPEQAHNDYLEFVASGGIVASLLGVWFLFRLIQIAIVRFRNSTYGFETVARAGAVCGIAGIAFHSFFDFGLQMFSNLLYFAAFVYLIVRKERESKTKKRSGGQPILAPIAKASVLFLLFLTGISMYVGLSRYVLSHPQGILADNAGFVAGLPIDAETYQVRSELNQQQGKITTAITDIKTAIALRPRDYSLWMKLGELQERDGLRQSALRSYYEAVKLAPYYASPRYSLGLLLYQTGNKAEAFSAFKFASRRNSIYFLKSAELAWKDSDGDTKELIRILSPLNTPETMMLGVFMLEHDLFQAVVEVTCNNNSANPSLRDFFTTRLIEKRRYRFAYLVKNDKCDSKPLDSRFSNGDFEKEEFREALGFGWQIAETPVTVKIARDMTDAYSNNASLRIRYNGASNPGTGSITQLVAVDPNTDYELRFSYKSEDLVSGSNPLLSIALKGGRYDGAVENVKLSPDQKKWIRVAVRLRTDRESEVIVVRLRREQCPTASCPIFGSLLLDDFELVRLE